MSSTSPILSSATTLGDAVAERLRLLVEDWQLLADLGYCDLLLWVRGEDGWVAAAHARPMTGPMAFVDDMVGTRPDRDTAEALDVARLAERVITGDALAGPAGVLMVPVGGAGGSAVMTRHRAPDDTRDVSALEQAYLDLADDLCRMILTGDWPSGSSVTGQRRGAPRVGDGVIRLDADGEVVLASPNAVSALRRLGHEGPLVGQVLAQVVSNLPQIDGPLDEGLALVTMGRAAWRAEVSAGGAATTLRAVPLVHRGQRTGALLLVRDVSTLRRREGELLSKDETIREIHHRVKNNLQTVAALLRMQSRRLEDVAGRTALKEAERRIGVIALVYEALSTGFTEEVDFDQVALRGLRAIVEVARTEHEMSSRVEGSFGWMDPSEATSVALIVSELVQNAVEHGLGEGGSILVTADRRPDGAVDILRVSIVDDGAGLPAGFRPSRAGLGTRIVTAMVEDLKGSIRWEDAEGGGTKVSFSARLKRRSG